MTGGRAGIGAKRILDGALDIRKVALVFKHRRSCRRHRSEGHCTRAELPSHEI